MLFYKKKESNKTIKKTNSKSKIMNKVKQESKTINKKIKQKIILAKDLMDIPVIVTPSTSIKKVKELLIGKEDSLLVAKNHKFYGEIHEFDLLKLIIPEDHLDEEEVQGIMGLGYDEEFFANNAGKITNTHEIFVTPKTKASDVALLLYKEDLTSIPVIEKKKIVGIIHLNKLIRKMLK